jgi:hypothetical protein
MGHTLMSAAGCGSAFPFRARLHASRASSSTRRVDGASFPCIWGFAGVDAAIAEQGNVFARIQYGHGEVVRPISTWHLLRGPRAGGQHRKSLVSLDP